MSELYIVKINFTHIDNPVPDTRIERAFYAVSPREIEDAMRDLLAPFDPIYTNTVAQGGPAYLETGCGFDLDDGDLYGLTSIYIQDRPSPHKHPVPISEIREIVAAMLAEIQVMARGDREAS